MQDIFTALGTIIHIKYIDFFDVLIICDNQNNCYVYNCENKSGKLIITLPDPIKAIVTGSVKSEVIQREKNKTIKVIIVAEQNKAIFVVSKPYDSDNNILNISDIKIEQHPLWISDYINAFAINDTVFYDTADGLHAGNFLLQHINKHYGSDKIVAMLPLEYKPYKNKNSFFVIKSNGNVDIITPTNNPDHMPKYLTAFPGKRLRGYDHDDHGYIIKIDGFIEYDVYKREITNYMLVCITVSGFLLRLRRVNSVDQPAFCLDIAKEYFRLHREEIHSMDLKIKPYEPVYIVYAKKQYLVYAELEPYQYSLSQKRVINLLKMEANINTKVVLAKERIYYTKGNVIYEAYLRLTEVDKF